MMNRTAEGRDRLAKLDAAPEAVRDSLPVGDPQSHYRRHEERPFTAEQRPATTILIGNLTPKHETLIRAVFERNGFRIASLPEPTKS